MNKYIDLELALNELLRLYEEDVERYGVEIRCGLKTPETFDYRRAREALSDLPTIEVSEDCDNCIWNTCNYNKVPWEVSEDCISREWVKGICEAMLDEEMLGHMLGHIEDAPSVVPTTEQSSIVHCKDCEYIDVATEDEGTSCYTCRNTRVGSSVDEWNYCCWGERIEE